MSPDDPQNGDPGRFPAPDANDPAAAASASWADRWREVLASDPGAARRLDQGYAWDRAGRVSQVRAGPGLLQGSVQGKSATPFAVRAHLDVFDDRAWEQVLDALASQARHHARLLAGLPPEGLETQLADHGVTLLPRRDELDTECPCGEPWPCIHLAAVWEAARALLEADPFLLFRLRGRGRQRLLADLTARRRGDGELAGIGLDALPVRQWAGGESPVDVTLPSADRHRTAPLLRLLGDPPGWEGRVSAWDTFAPLIEQAFLRGVSARGASGAGAPGSPGGG